jgi:hypothetical protein
VDNVQRYKMSLGVCLFVCVVRAGFCVKLTLSEADFGLAMIQKHVCEIAS